MWDCFSEKIGFCFFSQNHENGLSLVLVLTPSIIYHAKSKHSSLQQMPHMTRSHFGGGGHMFSNLIPPLPITHALHLFNRIDLVISYSRSGVFNLGYAYPWGYVGSFQGVREHHCRICIILLETVGVDCECRKKRHRKKRHRKKWHRKKRHKEKMAQEKKAQSAW